MSTVKTFGSVVVPTILFTTEALRWIKAMVDVHTDEVGFYCIVDREGNVFTISRVFYPKHDLATSATCEISKDGMSDIMVTLMSEDREDDISKLRVWGHSHHNMGVTPSGQDEAMGKELANDNGDFMIRLITNKKGEMGITLYDVVRGLEFTDLTYDVIKTDEECKKDIEAIALLLQSALYSDRVKNEMISSISEVKIINSDYPKIVETVKALKEINIPKPKKVLQDNDFHNSHKQVRPWSNDVYYRRPTNNIKQTIVDQDDDFYSDMEYFQ